MEEDAKDEVKIERAEVQECGDQSPVLRVDVSSWSGSSQSGDVYLVLVEDCTEAVEEVEGVNNMTLDQNARHHCGSCPISSADGHLEEPLLQRELARYASVPASS